MTLLNVPLPPQPMLGPPTSSLRSAWGKAATSAVQEMSVVKSDKEDACKHTKPLRSVQLYDIIEVIW